MWYNEDGCGIPPQQLPERSMIMKKRFLTAVLCLALLVSLIPAAELAAHAADGEGLWTTHRFANDYCGPDCECLTGVIEHMPEVGYKYTDEGFSVVPADFTGRRPAMSVVTKTKQCIKRGIYLQFRVDEYSYGGETEADHWIALSLSTEEKVYPGSTEYGGGLLTLLRGAGDGQTVPMHHLVEPKTEDSGGSFYPLPGYKTISVPRDGQGREIYTLEIVWNGSAYEVKINGEVPEGSAEITALLEKLSASGDFYVGISMYTAALNGKAALTILKYGTCEADAVAPAGDDSKEPEENCGFGFVDPLPSDTVPKNQPAILWNPDTYTAKSGHNCEFSVKGDSTWRVKATDPFCFMHFKPKASWSYNAEDFPVFGILLRGFLGEDGTLWYAAGEYLSVADGLTVPFSIYEGQFYGADDEYVLVPVNLTDLWEGRIHSLRLDLNLPDESAREFDICFAGMFRSEEEAYGYAEDYLGLSIDVLPDTDWVTMDPDVDDVTLPLDLPNETETENLTVGWVTLPEEVVSEIVSDVESILDTAPDGTVDAEQAVEDILAKYGCAGTLGGGMILLLAAAAFAVSRRKE